MPMEQIAKSAEQGGASVAVASWGVIHWLNENHQAVAALCAIAGLGIALAGFLVNLHYKRKREREYLK